MSDPNLQMQRQIQALNDGHEQLRKADVSGGAGAAFPAGATIGLTFFRTDLGFACYYDGTRWLTAHDYSLVLTEWLSFGTASPQATNPILPRGEFNPYVTRVLMHLRVAATNDGSNFWTVAVQGLNTAASSSTSIYSTTTAADAAATIVRRDTAPSTADPTHRDWFRVTLTKTGSPGAVECATTLTYKLIIT